MKKMNFYVSLLLILCLLLIVGCVQKQQMTDEELEKEVKELSSEQQQYVLSDEQDVTGQAFFTFARDFKLNRIKEEIKIRQALSQCIDSDNGRNYFETGTVSEQEKSRTDYCQDYNYLFEYDCGFEGRIGFIDGCGHAGLGGCRFDCSSILGYVCMDGRCVNESDYSASLVWCDTDNECLSGYMCMDGECVNESLYTASVAWCENDNVCAEGYHCVNNECYFSTTYILNLSPENPSVNLQSILINDIINFNVNEINYSLEFKAIFYSSERVKITIIMGSVPQTVYLKLNKPLEVDLNVDGINDIRITLTALTINNADLKIDLLEIPPENLDMPWEISKNKTLVNGIYNIPEGIEIESDDVVLDCNGATLIGNWNTEENYGIYESNGVFVGVKENVKIKNCNLINYNRGILIYNSDNTILNNNTICDNNIDVFLENSINTVSENNICSITSPSFMFNEICSISCEDCSISCEESQTPTLSYAYTQTITFGNPNTGILGFYQDDNTIPEANVYFFIDNQYGVYFYEYSLDFNEPIIYDTTSSEIASQSLVGKTFTTIQGKTVEIYWVELDETGKIAYLGIRFDNNNIHVEFENDIVQVIDVNQGLIETNLYATGLIKGTPGSLEGISYKVRANNLPIYLAEGDELVDPVIGGFKLIFAEFVDAEESDTGVAYMRMFAFPYYAPETPYGPSEGYEFGNHDFYLGKSIAEVDGLLTFQELPTILKDGELS